MPASEERGRTARPASRMRPGTDTPAPVRAARDAAPDDRRAPRRAEARNDDHRPSPPRGAPRPAEAERPPRGARAFHQDKPARTPRPDERPRGAAAERSGTAERPFRPDAPPQRAAPQRPEVLRNPRAPRAALGPADGASPVATPPNTYWLYGLHAVEAALRNTARRGHRLLLTADAEASLAARLPPEALTRGRLTPERADRQRFQTFLTEDAVHQGAAMLVEPLTNSQLERVVAARPGPVVLLDQVTDPRNVGAILRSAAAFGAAAVVLQSRHAPPETGAMARAASGALDLVPIVREVNLARTIQSLQKLNFWVVGLAGDASRTLAEAGLSARRIALVLGSEDAGLRRLQRETCDELLRLPMAEGVESLNVSAAAAVALYEVSRR